MNAFCMPHTAATWLIIISTTAKITIAIRTTFGPTLGPLDGAS